MTAALTKTASGDAPKLLLPVQSIVQPKLISILDEINELNFERAEIAWSMVVALISQQHLLMVGPGGTAKSKIVRDLLSHIVGANYFETALDETSTPDQILGPPDIKTMVEEGKTRRVPDGMLPTAHIAFIDEFFNGNGPVLHSIMPILNERLFHNNGKPCITPLMSAFAGTNKLNADQDQAALWDRIHIRHQVGYVKDRDNLNDLLRAAMARQVSTYTPAEPTVVNIDELRQGRDEAMQLKISDITMDTYLDLIETLGHQGVEVSTRRQVEGLKAIVANAWLQGHSEVLVGDLGIIQHMFWTNQDDISKVKGAVLTACNPGEKKALELLDDLSQLVEEYKKAGELDQMKRNNIGVDLFKKTGKIMDAASPLREKAEAAGASTIRIDELIKQTQHLKIKIGTEVFNLTEEQILDIKNGRR
jgi:MoxR-like ATPase